MEAKLKHLDYIQAAIARMATNSFLFKGWSITIAVGLSAFAAADTRRALLAIAILSTVMFWGLDGYYLWLERGFVALHTKVSAMADEDIDFSMAIDKQNAFRRWLRTSVRYHLVFFYGTIILVELIGITIIKKGK